MKLRCVISDSIPNGTKFVAICSDGSGSSLFFVDKYGFLIDSDGEEIDNDPQAHLFEAGYLYWIKLPKEFKLWFEQK